MKKSLPFIFLAALIAISTVTYAQNTNKIPNVDGLGKAAGDLVNNLVNEDVRQEMVNTRGKLSVLSCLTLIKLHYKRNYKLIARQLYELGFAKAQHKQLNEKYLYANLDYCMTIIKEADLNVVINNLKKEEIIVRQIRQNLAVTDKQLQKIIGDSLEITPIQMDLKLYIAKEFQFDVQANIQSQEKVIKTMEEVEELEYSRGFKWENIWEGVKWYLLIVVIMLVSTLVVALIKRKNYRNSWGYQNARSTSANELFEETDTNESYSTPKKKQSGSSSKKHKRKNN